MPDKMDINAGRIAKGEAMIEDVGQEIYEEILKVAHKKDNLTHLPHPVSNPKIIFTGCRRK
ncbi:UxaA family hydrolase [Neomoorella mulderi]|uniref:UxaA family hydrolase n=1 Tax=Neomoorella mulderi TaxID=202604 RepID=UPI000AD1712C|nr:UxaA family hydrolase [Moorella mulderi]